MQLLAKPPKWRLRLSPRTIKVVKCGIAVALCTGACGLAWLTIQSYRTTQNEISARAESAKIVDSKMAAQIEADTLAENRLLEAASHSPANAAAYVNWLIAHERSRDALAWIDQLSPDLLNSGPIRDCRAQLLAIGSRWEELHTALLRGDWGSADPDALQLAFTARLAARSSHTELAPDLWHAAWQTAGSSAQTRKILGRLGQVWVQVPRDKGLFAPPEGSGGLR